MKLNTLEAKVIGALSLRGDASISEISKIVKARSHSCRYAIDSLISKGLLNRRVIINCYKLGYSIYALWFSLNAKYRRDSKELFTYLKNSKYVGYIGEQDGEFPYRIDLYCKDLRELHNFLIDLGDIFGEVFQTKHVSLIYSITDFSLKHFNPGDLNFTECRVGFENEVESINEIDHKILQALSQIEHKTHSSIARELNIPLATLEYRIKSLKKKKIILAYHTWSQVENINSVGIKLTLYRLKFSLLDKKLISEIEEFSKKNLYVFSLTQFIGEYDFELCISTKNSGEEKMFKDLLEKEFGSKISSTIIVTLSGHKKISNYPC